MFNKKTLRVATLFVAICLASCEGGTTFTKTIENKTSQTITVRLFSIYGAKDTVSLSPNESKQIFIDDQMGSFTDKSYTCTTFIDSVQVTITNGKTLIKDIKNSNNWIRESKGGRNSREDCTFIITNSDIQ